MSTTSLLLNIAAAIFLTACATACVLAPEKIAAALVTLAEEMQDHG